ncbi:MAG: hypothetical protein M3680_06645 [Myxococcota bacterium]|nr:hypothetical protein [Myxococcota bacterium]
MLVGCQSSSTSTNDLPDGDSSPSVPSTPLSVGPARQIDAPVGRELHFKAKDGGFTAAFETHSASIRAGVAKVTPVEPSRAGGRPRVGEALTIETLEVRAGGSKFDSKPESSRINPAGDLLIDLGRVTEVWKNREDGLRQEWIFESAPTSDDIVVEVGVRGQAYVGTTAHGLHFSGASGLGFRYSHAIWIDSASKSWEIPATFENGRIQMKVPQSVLVATTFPATLDPTVSAEIGVDTPVAGSTGANATAPAVAFDGTNYLVVWTDFRGGNNADIWGARVSQAGAVLDPAAIQIATLAGIQQNPTVAFDGTQFVVAWEDLAGSNLRTAIVSSAGAVVLLPLVPGSGTGQRPMLAGGAGGALLVWQAGANVLASSFAAGAFGTAFAVAPGSAPAVAAAGSTYLVTYTAAGATSDDLRGRLVASGAPSGAEFDISAALGAQLHSTAAFDGTNFVVAWANNYAGLDIYGTRVSPAGVVLDVRAEGEAMVGGVPLVVAEENQESPALACSAAVCQVSWQDRRNLQTTGFDIYGQRLTTTSALTLSGSEFAISSASGNQFAPRVAMASSGDAFTVWQDHRSGNAVLIVGARSTAGGSVLDANGIVLSLGTNQEQDPTVARAGSTLAVAWSDGRNPEGADIMTVRYDLGLGAVDANAVAVSSATGAQIRPAGAGMGTNFIFAWSDARSSSTGFDIYASRVGPTGAPLDASGIPVAVETGLQLLPEIASSGNEALVVWQDGRGASFDIYGSIISSAGTASAPFAITTAAGDDLNPSVTYNAGAGVYIVAWMAGGGTNIFASRVTTAGAVQNAGGVPISNGGIASIRPRLASSGSTTLAVWEDRKNGNSDVYGTRLTAGDALTVLDPNGIAITIDPAKQITPSVASLDNSFLVVWADPRTGGVANHDIFGQQVASSGALVEGNFVISAGPENETNPDVIDISPNDVLVAYQKLQPTISANRIMLRSVQASQVAGTVCTTTEQCSTGSCVDGYCCDQACGGNDPTDCQACSFSRTLQPNGTCAPIAAGTSCRYYADLTCDTPEYCDGATPSCPPDLGRNGGSTCAIEGGGTGTCPADAAAGPHVCQ